MLDVFTGVTQSAKTQAIHRQIDNWSRVERQELASTTVVDK